MLRPDVQLGAARRTRFRELERPPSTGALDVLHALLADAHDEKVGSIWSQEVEVVPTITLVVGGDRSRIQPSSDAREQHEDFELARNVLHTHGHRVDSRIRVDLGRHQAVHTHTLPTGRESRGARWEWLTGRCAYLYTAALLAHAKMPAWVSHVHIV
jgi:hypothetical protein